MSGAESSEIAAAALKAKASAVGLSAEAEARAESSQKESQQIEEKFRRSKTDFLHRHILITKPSSPGTQRPLSCDGYLFLEDCTISDVRINPR